jgi:hypothetical protein
MNRLLFLISFLISTFLVAQVPSYYGSIDFTQEGNALKDDLSTLIISTHTNWHLLYNSHHKRVQTDQYL